MARKERQRAEEEVAKEKKEHEEHKKCDAAPKLKEAAEEK